ESDIIKIQAFIRANKARDDYKTLISAEQPPMAVVRKFVHLLDQSDQDFQEELEMMRLREEVVTRIRSNQQLENDLNTMDIKIGLLVKNKITLQEVVSHSKKLTRKNKEQLSDMMKIDRQKGGLKGLSKEKRMKLEAYQNLFYLLQTNPTYLAKLIFQMPQNKSTKFMDSVIFTLYNYASNQREEYLLLKLFKTALQEEIKSKVDQIHEIITGNPTVIKMVVSFNRGARGQNALRQILAPVVKEIIEEKTMNIKTDPVDIYKAWVNQMESQTGEASKLPYDVTPDQALGHEEVRQRLDASIKNMRTVTDKFLSAIVTSVDKIPYGMRIIAKVLKDSLHEKFPDATDEELIKIVGNLLYYRYMNPAIVAPDAFDIIDLSAGGGGLSTDQRRNLGSIAKVLQHAASNKMFDKEYCHLASINEYLSHAHHKFRRFIQAACEVPELEDKFNIDEYSDLVTLNKPVIYISIGEIINTHTLFLDHQDAIAPDHNDPIHELLEDLGEVPTIESMIGEGGMTDAGKEQLAKTEVSLSLTNKFDVSGGENEEMNARTLLLNTKRLIVDVIRFQAGETLTEILESPASPEQDADHQRAMQRRAIRDAKTPEKIKRNQLEEEENQMTLTEKKEKIVQNLKKLAALGKVNPQNKYQDLINDVAKVTSPPWGPTPVGVSLRGVFSNVLHHRNTGQTVMNLWNSLPQAALFLDHQDAIAPDHNDPIHELLEDLGEVPTIESMIGEGGMTDAGKEQLAKTEVSLSLTNKFDVSGGENEEMNARTLLLNTKRLIVDVIRFQAGETLTEILESPASPEQDADHQRAMQRRAIRDAKTPEKIKRNQLEEEENQMTLTEKKEKIVQNLKKLAALGKVNPQNKYQDLINDVAKDIRNQRRYRQRRKAELVRLQQTYSGLISKTTFYEEQIDYYNQYIKTCMDNLASKGKVSKKPGERNVKGKKSKQVSQRYTAARLHEKGVLLEIEDLNTNQFKNVIFDICPTEEVGDFEVKAKFMGVQMDSFMLHYQDLLQLQYEGVAVMKLFDKAKVNVNLLIFLLNKKFYGK
ncbi:ras GTPase-activating-like protein IQGAP1, partial [Mobula birostris]|uniref:ras GTPase-activating-like protein IQGAP1 n=1 Tax=Mobula birostris TaxID=1983395 RepID=UPI003B28BF70